MAAILGTVPQVAPAGGNTITRLREAAYNSPSGNRLPFTYETVRRAGTKRGQVFEFADINDGFAQQRGFGSRRYPIRAIFHGPNHDIEATAFEAALYEPGRGELEHPRYGKIKGVPMGDIARTDDLVAGVGQSTVEFTFFTSLETVYPSGSTSPKSEIEAALDGYADAAAAGFDETTDLRTATAKASTASTIKGALREVSSKLREASDAVADVRRDFADVQAAINNGIDILIGQPLLLARQIVDLVLFPARAVGGFLSRLEGYADLFDSISSSAAGNPGISGAYAQVGLRLQQRNDLEVASLVAGSAVAGQVATVVNTTFTTRPQALAAAATLLEQHDAYVAWHDAATDTVGTVDTGAAGQQLRRAVALAAGHLIEISFTLVAERRITLDRPRTIIDLAAELYGSVDDKLDLLITSNDLAADEILELPRGRQIVYYPS